jgi:carbon-monoxide dehydrogenase medium subunit
MEAARGTGWGAQTLSGATTDAGKIMCDILGDAAYRANLVGVLAGRAVAAAG